MITKNPMQLKAYIKKKAAEKHISAQLVMQNYMLERLLERISLSPYPHSCRGRTDVQRWRFLFPAGPADN